MTNLILKLILTLFILTFLTFAVIDMFKIFENWGMVAFAIDEDPFAQLYPIPDGLPGIARGTEFEKGTKEWMNQYCNDLADMGLPCDGMDRNNRLSNK